LYALGRRRNGPQEAAGGARSTDGGATWIDMAIDSTVAYSLTLDPRRPERLYASTSRGLYRSTDRGRTWQPLTEGVPSHQPGLWPSFEILVDPDQPGLVWAAQKTFGFALLKSEDGGDHWQTVAGAGIPESAVVESLVKPPVSGVLYVSTTLGIYRSDDGGDTWLPWNGGLVVPVDRLAVDPR